MSRHPKERSTPAGLSRRDFLRRAGAAGIALPSLSAILAACADTTADGGDGNGNVDQVELVSPKNPVTLPLHEDVPAIAEGLSLESGPLRVYNWDDYIYKKVVNSFKEEFGVEVEYTPFTGMSEAISKIQNGTIEWDVFFPTVENIPKLVSAKRVQPLNLGYIPNLSNIWTQ